MDREHLLNMIAVLFGGRIAEELFMNQMTTGASNDFERATEIARDMVTRWGMSDALGPMVYGENEGEVFLGRSITTHKNVSEATMQKVDDEIRSIIDEQYALARKLLEDNRDKVEAMAKALLEMGNARRRPDRRHHGRQAAAPAQADAVVAGPVVRRHDRRRRTPRRRPIRRRRRRSATTGPRRDAAARALPCRDELRHLRCGTHTLDLARPLRDGHRQRHARFVLRRRPVSSIAERALDARARDGGGRRRHHRRRRRIDAARRARRSPRTRSSRACMPRGRGARRARASLVSVDTRKPGVMRAAIAAGAAMINDVARAARAGRARGRRRERRRACA